MFAGGLALTTVSSAACGWAPTVAVLDVSRIVMGASAGIVIAQVMGFIQTTYEGARRGRALGVYSAAVGVSSAIAPALGGGLMVLSGTEDGWRWLFWMNVPPGAVLFALAVWLLPGNAGHTRNGQGFDILGLGLLAVATVALLLPFILTNVSGGDSPWRWSWLIVSAGAIVLFVRWEGAFARRGGDPILDMRLVRLPAFRNGLLVGAAYFGAFQAITLLLLMYTQRTLGQSPFAAGCVAMAFTLGSAFSAVRSGALLQRYGSVLVTFGVGGALTAVILVLCASLLLPRDVVLAGIIPAMLLMGMCGGLVIAPNQTLILREVRAEQSALMGAVVQLFQRVGGSIGIAVTMSVYFATANRAESSPAELSEAFRNGVISVAVYIAVAFVCSVLASGRGLKQISRVRR